MMNEFYKKIELSKIEMKSKGADFQFKDAWILKMFWKIGIKLKPAPYEKIWINTLMLGTLWGVPLFCLMYATIILSSSIFGTENTLSVIQFTLTHIGAGLVFGLSMALLAAYSHRKHGLSDWDDLK